MLDDETKTQRAQELRGRLRDGRNRPPEEDSSAAGGASAGDGRNPGAPDPAIRATVQDAGRTARDLAPTGGKPDTGNRRTRNNESGASGVAGRSRRQYRRNRE